MAALNDIPNFDLGLTFDFSSSGDELISKIEEEKCSSTRFHVTSETEKKQILDNIESSNTKKSTKFHIKVFRGLNSI